MTAERICGFGYKTGWLAVRDAPAVEVFSALGCRTVGPVGWLEGVTQTYEAEDLVAGTPELPGRWTLVFGWWVASRADHLDVAALSATLGREVQLFVSHRIVELHRWERAVDGALIRSFEYLGERGQVTRWYGKPDDVERAVGVPTKVALGDMVVVDEADVMRVAGAWSVDPTSLEGQPAPAPLVLGRFTPDKRAPRPKPSAAPQFFSATDLIISDLSNEELNARIAERERSRG